MSEAAICEYLNVTAALIPSGGRLFVAQRPPWKRYGHLWEFPGGKVEKGEGFQESLVREIEEELCLRIAATDLFRTISYHENNSAIHLHAYWCVISGGQFCLREHVAFRWAKISELRGIALTTIDRLLVPFLEILTTLPRNPRQINPCMRAQP
ncbi:MAG: NUDIX domain-containing protein [Syntrophobacteraceae bacterium]